MRRLAALRNCVRPPRRSVRCCVWPRGAVLDARGLSTSSSGHSGLPKGLDTSNPFEIKFHVEDLPEDAAEELAGIESCFFEDEIEKFHSEMIGVFGSQPEEHDDSATSHAATQPSTPRSLSQHQHASVPAHTVVTSEATPTTRWARDVQLANPVPQHPPVSRQKAPVHAAPASTAIKLIQGPCTYVHNSWVGSKDRWSASEVEAMVERIAQTHGLHVTPHHSNHEGQILDWLLSTSPGDKIILNWNGRLADSLIIFRALSSIRAFVVVLAPLDVELGPLPSSVKGVITGFGTKSLDLAIQACK